MLRLKYIHGEQGSAKSTFQEFIKDLVDPSGVITLAFPKSVAEIVQQLSHNYVAYYDNVSSLPQWVSDVLCRAVTPLTCNKFDTSVNVGPFNTSDIIIPKMVL